MHDLVTNNQHYANKLRIYIFSLFLNIRQMA